MFGGPVWFRLVPVAVAAWVGLIALVVVTVVDSARARAWARGLAAMSVLGILVVTLGAPGGAAGSNLVPGRTIVAELTHVDHPVGLLNLVGNVVLFLPLGWLLALVTARHRLAVAALVGVGLSATIEVMQSLIGRVSDVDDVILNGSGAVLGACIAMLILAAGSRSPGSASLGEPSRN